MNFTVEEENLICIFDVGNRGALISAIRNAIPGFDEPEMLDIAESALRKLEGITDAEFSRLILHPVYYDEETEKNVYDK